MPDVVLAATKWPSNAELILDVAENLKYLKRDRLTLDPTYEGGIWWGLWQPNPGCFITHHRPTDGSDFRRLPYADGHFRQIAYDPPYAAEGGATNSTMREYSERYGRDTVASAAHAVQMLINDGLTEMWRLIAPDGIVLVKCMDYVWNAELWVGTHWTLTHAIALGFVVEEELRMYDTKAGPQPFRSICSSCSAAIQRRREGHWTDMVRSGPHPGAGHCRLPDGIPGTNPHTPTLDDDGQVVLTQDHAYYNALSTLFVLRKPTGRRPRQYQFAPPAPAGLDPTRLAL